MIGKLLALPFVMIVAGLLMGLTGVGPLASLGTLLFLAGGTMLGVGAFLAVAILVEGFVFRSADRWHRFN